MKRFCGILFVLLVVFVFVFVSCGGGGGGGGGTVDTSGTSTPAASNSLTGCWWVYTETAANGDVVKTELNFDNSNMRIVAYLNNVMQLDGYVPYTLSGNTISYNPSTLVVTYSITNYTVNNVTSASFDYSVNNNSLTLSNGKQNGVSTPVAIINGSHSSIVLTRK